MSQSIIRRPQSHNWNLAQIREYLATAEHRGFEYAMIKNLSDMLQQCERTLGWYGSIHQYVAGTSLSGTRAARVLDDAGERARGTLRHIGAHNTRTEGESHEQGIVANP